MINEALYVQLQEVAGNESLTTYQEAGDVVELDMDNPLDRNTIAAMLDEINKYEASQGRPMLSAVVVHAGEDNMPGRGFFECARGLGKPVSRDRLAEIGFWAKEVRRVYEYWVKAG